MERCIAQSSMEVAASAMRAAPYLKRGECYFRLREHAKAIDDFTRAITLDDALDDAYFGRGMALARDGQVDEGIADLTVYIRRNPGSSLAYTKRGVRHIWRGTLEEAEHDLRKAIALDPENGEAHDDLGAVLAQRGNLASAAEHFLVTIRLDPTYQKAYHNLALTRYLGGSNEAALAAVNHSLRLVPHNRSSVLLKAEILTALGRAREAEALREEAEFLPAGNWSEHSQIQ
jgi:tetratricopeptide (TPR) repeat protein